MEVRAVAKFIRVQPRKVRQVAREVRGKSAPEMVQVLQFHPSKSASVLRKVIASAVANAQENHGLDPSSLRVAEIQVNEGPRIKRIQARAMGRANRILKRTSHIVVVVEDDAPTAVVKPHGTKAKPRPTLAKPISKKKAAKVQEKEEVSEAPAVEEVAEDAAVAAEGTAEVTTETESAEAEKADEGAAETEGEEKPE